MTLAARLCRRKRPLFGQVVVWCLLVSAINVGLWPFEVSSQGARHPGATFLSVLPEEWLAQPALWLAVRGVLVAAAVLWGCQLLVPWSCWLTVAAFLTFWSLHLETVSSGAHIMNISGMLLVVHALWYHFYRRDIAAARAEGRFWSTPLYPRWAFWLSLFYIGLYHSWGGVSKLRYSGLEWANGVSLQLWVHLWGLPYSVSRAVILSHRLLAQFFQGAALFFETFSLPSIFIPRLRVLVGLGMAGFYLSVIEAFNYGFHYNLVFTVLFFLPCERLADMMYAEGLKRKRPRGRP
jgi:hypothetical protein